MTGNDLRCFTNDQRQSEFITGNYSTKADKLKLISTDKPKRIKWSDWGKLKVEL